MACKKIRVVGNAGEPDVADTEICVPTNPRRQKTLCNCAKMRGKHERTDTCIDSYEVIPQTSKYES